MSHTIRLARPDDLDALPAVEARAAMLFERCLDVTGLPAELLGRVSVRDDFEDALRDGTLWVAAANAADAGAGEADAGELIGFALVRIVGGLPHLDEVDVLPEHGQRGVGSQLLEAVCAWAAGAGHPAVTLSTFRDVPWNAPFYARRGFRIVSPADLSDEHVALVEDERLRGLRVDLRVMMERRLQQAAGSGQWAGTSAQLAAGRRQGGHGGE